MKMKTLEDKIKRFCHSKVEGPPIITFLLSFTFPTLPSHTLFLFFIQLFLKKSFNSLTRKVVSTEFLFLRTIGGAPSG